MPEIQEEFQIALRLISESMHYRSGYCRDCGVFSGLDKIQDVQGDEHHDQYCHFKEQIEFLRRHGHA